MSRAQRPQKPQRPEPPANPRVLVLVDEIAHDPAQMGYADKAASQIADLLNAEGSAPNPAPQRNVPVLRSVVQAMAVITGEEAAAIYSIGNGELKRDAEAAIRSGDQAAIQAVFKIVAVYLSPESQAALTELVMATEPDPTWQPTIATPSRAKRIGLNRVQTTEVALALVEAAK